MKKPLWLFLNKIQGNYWVFIIPCLSLIKKFLQHHNVALENALPNVTTATVSVFLGYLKNTESYNFSIILYTARLVSGERFSNLWIKG